MPCQSIIRLCLPWIGGNDPTALQAMMVCLFSTPADGKPAENQKGPHRRCFKMSSLFRLAGETTGGVNSRYLTDFLTNSRVGGHPQARATLGKAGDKKNRCRNQEVFCSLLLKILQQPRHSPDWFLKIGYNASAVALRRQLRRPPPKRTCGRHPSGDAWIH